MLSPCGLQANLQQIVDTETMNIVSERDERIPDKALSICQTARGGFEAIGKILVDGAITRTVVRRRRVCRGKGIAIEPGVNTHGADLRNNAQRQAEHNTTGLVGTACLVDDLPTHKKQISTLCD
jgi:hypothetical protein